MNEGVYKKLRVVSKTEAWKRMKKREKCCGGWGEAEKEKEKEKEKRKVEKKKGKRREERREEEKRKQKKRQ